MTIPPNPCPRSPHVSVARHDLRNPLGEIQGFADIFLTCAEVRPVVTGMIGRHKFSYDLWGDTVNTASRMESNGVIGAVQVSSDTHLLIEGDYNFTRRELSQVKGKGDLTAWLLTRRRSETTARPSTP